MITPSFTSPRPTLAILAGWRSTLQVRSGPQLLLGGRKVSHPPALAGHVEADDTLSEGEVFAEAKSFQGTGEPDGVLVCPSVLRSSVLQHDSGGCPKVDSKCNVFLTGGEGVLVFDREGENLGAIFFRSKRL